MMRRLTTRVVAGLLLCAASALAQAPEPAKARDTTPEIPYDSVPNFFKMPSGLYMGEGIAVATNSKGHVYVYVRSGDSRMFEFDPNGNFIKEFGKDSYAYSFAHGVRVDYDENVWTVDEGTNVIVKYAPDGKLLMVMGKRPDPIDQLAMMPGVAPFSGANRPYSYHRPTDIGFDRAGNVYVSDGYTDSRVVKYDKNGRFIISAGTRGNGPLQFMTPHTIAVAHDGTVFVGDRGNRRIVVLDTNLNQKAVYDTVGAPWGLCISAGEHQYVYTSNSISTAIDSRTIPTTGDIYKIELDGTVLGHFGKAGKAMKEFASIHHLDCRDPNTVYVAEIQAWRVQKLLLHPERMTSSAGN